MAELWTKAEALRADCARCAALCCVAPAFDRSPEFAYDKPACVACRHLADDDRCRIHARRGREGFSGCVQFDCLGAGQRVVQEVYAGRSWRDEPELLDEMGRCFSVLRQVHELLLLLLEARKLELPARAQAMLRKQMRMLDPAVGWSAQSLLALDIEPIRAEAFAVLASLRGHVEPRAAQLAGRNKFIA